MIARATEADKERCLSLYEACFGDPRDFAEGIWDSFHNDCLVLWEDGRAVSMAYYPALTVGDCQAGYIYGACTLPEYRGGGRMRRLLAAVLSEMETRGDAFAFLVPVEDSLVSYYERFGFAPGFFVETGRLVQDHAGAAPAKRAEASDFARINAVYEKENEGVWHIRRDRAFYERYQALSAPEGFFVCPEGYAFADRTGGRLFLREVGGDFAKVTASVMAALGVAELDYRLPAESGALHGCVRPVCGKVPGPLRLNLLWD